LTGQSAFVAGSSTPPGALIASRDQRALDKRERIQNAAIRTIAEQGFDRCRVSDVARRAGVSHGLVYHYFESKDELLLSIFRDRLVVLVDLARALRADAGGAAQKLGKIVGFVVDSYCAYPRLMKVLFQELVRTPEFFAEANILALDDAHDVFAEIIRDGIDTGELSVAVDPQLAARVFWGALQGVVAGWAWRDIPADRLGDVARTKRELTNLVLQGLLASESRPPRE